MILRMEDFPVRTLVSSILVSLLAFGLIFAATPVSAQDDLALVCSAPVDGAILGVVPTTVTLTLSAEPETVAVTVSDADGNALEGVEASADGAVVTVAAAFEAGVTYTVSLDDTDVSITFTVAENALVVDEPQLVNDCPAVEEPAVEATEEPMVEATEEATEEPMVEATEEVAEVAVLSEEVYEDSAGNIDFSVNLPADYVAVENTSFFLFPVVVMAADEDTANAYVSTPDSVDSYVVIYTTFTSEDLPAFGLTTAATAEEIVSALIRSDSEVLDQTMTEVAGAPAVRVRFTNETSGKDGIFYVVSFADEEATGYLLIQGSAASDSWSDYESAFEALVASITVLE